jgi:hypothetical protein
LLRVDTKTEDIEVLLTYESPAEVTADEEPAVLFKQGYLANDVLYLSTQTEILILAYPSLERLGYISLPSFHDVHHVRPTGTGTLLAVNTGLDQLLELTTDGDVVNRWHVLGGEPWGDRYSPDVDYRKMSSTKPYDSHPNHTFMLDDEVWVTRFIQRDAVAINNPERRIDIGLSQIHDGLVTDDHIYFTTVSGNVAIADRQTLEVVEVVNLNDISDGSDILGWCRGIAIGEDGVWVGMSRLRATAIRENVSWVKEGFRRTMPTHIARYDLEKRTLEQRIELEDYDLSAVFSLIPV